MDALKITIFFLTVKVRRSLQKIWKIGKYKEENEDDLTVHHTEVISANVSAFFRPVFAELHICLKHNCSVNIVLQTSFMCSHIVNVPTSLCTSTMFVITSPVLEGSLFYFTYTL